MVCLARALQVGQASNSVAAFAPREPMQRPVWANSKTSCLTRALQVTGLCCLSEATPFRVLRSCAAQGPDSSEVGEASGHSPHQYNVARVATRICGSIQGSSTPHSTPGLPTLLSKCHGARPASTVQTAWSACASAPAPRMDDTLIKPFSAERLGCSPGQRAPGRPGPRVRPHRRPGRIGP